MYMKHVMKQFCENNEGVSPLPSTV